MGWLARGKGTGGNKGWGKGGGPNAGEQGEAPAFLNQTERTIEGAVISSREEYACYTGGGGTLRGLVTRGDRIHVATGQESNQTTGRYAAHVTHATTEKSGNKAQKKREAGPLWAGLFDRRAG